LQHDDVPFATASFEQGFKLLDLVFLRAVKLASPPAGTPRRLDLSPKFIRFSPFPK
jgi:hypothetical protein